MAVDFVLFHRLASRCLEVTRDPGVSPVITAVYEASSKEPLEGYLAAFAAVEDGVSRWRRAREGAARALAELDPVFRSARSAVAAVEPAVALPKTLKALTTDTDKRCAIEQLLGIVGGFAGEAWADVLLQGDFGRLAVAAIQAILGAYEAAVALDRARKARVKAFKPAWAAFLAFRRVVRDAYGKGSNEYQRLRVRSAASVVEDTGVPAAERPAERVEIQGAGTMYGRTARVDRAWPNAMNAIAGPDGKPLPGGLRPCHRGAAGRRHRDKVVRFSPQGREVVVPKVHGRSALAVLPSGELWLFRHQEARRYDPAGRLVFANEAARQADRHRLLDDDD